MKACSGFKPNPVLPRDHEKTCKNCVYENCSYCRPIGQEIIFEERTPIEDRYPADCTDTHSLDYMG